MAIMLPGEVSYLLNMLGFEWPEGNEDRIFDYATRWMTYAGEVGSANQLAGQAKTHALTNNSGPAMTAFQQAFDEAEGVRDVAEKLALAGTLTGGCLLLVGVAVIALKIAFVVNLVLLAIQIAEAVAAAAATFGASLAWIPIAKEIARRLLELALNLAIEKLMGGE
ncbi:hypothetical protein [Arachnia propionica]|uniref:WXG100-like domain-containing protein n=1 Tax=Arachnia propionica TaxID=1750 RepID=UPI00242DF182|nr:hypothetical protein [Arachnia propionica]